MTYEAVGLSLLSIVVVGELVWLIVAIVWKNRPK